MAGHRLSRLAAGAAAAELLYIDDFSGVVVREFSLATYAELFRPQNRRHHPAHGVDGGGGDGRLGHRRLPHRLYGGALRARERWKALFYLGIMLPLWASYLVKIYAWKLILAKEGILNWIFEQLHITLRCSTGRLALPVIGGNSLSIQLHRHVHRLPLCLAALHDPADPGGDRARAGEPASRRRPTSARRRAQTFRHVILPLALPGVVAGSIFTFSLTLGDYIIPQIIGNARFFIGQVGLLRSRARPGNIPLAAAFTVVPIVIMGIYSGAAPATGGVRCALTARRAPLGLLGRGDRGAAVPAAAAAADLPLCRSRPRSGPINGRRRG